MGLVQPASAVLYDYYNPGEGSGTLGRVGLGGSEGWRVLGVHGLGRQRQASALMNAPLCFSPEHKCSVFYGAPRKSKLLSTLCSADVCQCAEGETPDRGSGVGRGLAGAYTVSPGPLTSGKCPRQRRALDRGQQDMEGYRMKFACYSPRVDYGQSSCPGPGPDRDPATLKVS